MALDPRPRNLAHAHREVHAERPARISDASRDLDERVPGATPGLNDALTVLKR
jgi:hypothetical protein